MPFYELHPLNYTILCYTKGDLFSMLYGSFSILYGSFLDFQTLSPKVSLVIIRKEKRRQAIQQKIKRPDLFSVFSVFYLLYFISELRLFPRGANCSDFWKKKKQPCLQEFKCQTNMCLIMCIWQQGLKFATGWVIWLSRQFATSFRRNYTRSFVISRIKNPHHTWLCRMVWSLDI